LGKKKSKSKTKTQPWAPVQPAILDAVNTASGIVRGNQGNLDTLASGVRGQLPALQAMAFGPNASLTAANGYAQDVLGGKYLNEGNPYLSGMLDETRQNVGNQVNQTFSMAGRTGGGNHVQRLGQGLASAENALRYQDYSAERDRMAQQASLVPGLSAAQFAGIAPWLAATQTAGNLPYAGVGALSPIIGLANGSGTTTSSQPGGWGTALMGAAASAAPFIFSDPRLKKNVKKIGEREDGLGVYEYEYRQNVMPKGKQVGVMADEVAALRPDALGPLVGGFLTIAPEKL
jgi:hypothetical protein